MYTSLNQGEDKLARFRSEFNKIKNMLNILRRQYPFSKELDDLEDELENIRMKLNEVEKINTAYINNPLRNLMAGAYVSKIDAISIEGLSDLERLKDKIYKFQVQLQTYTEMKKKEEEKEKEKVYYAPEIPKTTYMIMPEKEIPTVTIPPVVYLAGGIVLLLLLLR